MMGEFEIVCESARLQSLSGTAVEGFRKQPN
jgi:hypothetical protein